MTSATIKVLHISFDTDTSRYRVTLSNTLFMQCSATPLYLLAINILLWRGDVKREFNSIQISDRENINQKYKNPIAKRF